MVSAEISLSLTPQSFRQRFSHFIPKGDDLVTSTLPVPKLNRVPWSSENTRHAQGHANLDHPSFFFVQKDARAAVSAVSQASHPTLHVNVHQIRTMVRADV